MRVGILLACVTVHHVGMVPEEAGRGQYVPCNWSYGWLCHHVGAGTEPRSVGKTASVLTHGAILPVLLFDFF